MRCIPSTKGPRGDEVKSVNRIIAKSLSVANAPDRFQDLDDLKQLFKDVKDLDIDYIRRRLYELSLAIPQTIKQFAPRSLR